MDSNSELLDEYVSDLKEILYDYSNEYDYKSTDRYKKRLSDIIIPEKISYISFDQCNAGVTKKIDKTLIYSLFIKILREFDFYPIDNYVDDCIYLSYKKYIKKIYLHMTVCFDRFKGHYSLNNLCDGKMIIVDDTYWEFVGKVKDHMPVFLEYVKNKIIGLYKNRNNLYGDSKLILKVLLHELDYPTYSKLMRRKMIYKILHNMTELDSETTDINDLFVEALLGDVNGQIDQPVPFFPCEYVDNYNNGVIYSTNERLYGYNHVITKDKFKSKTMTLSDGRKILTELRHRIVTHNGKEDILCFPSFALKHFSSQYFNMEQAPKDCYLFSNHPFAPDSYELSDFSKNLLTVIEPLYERTVKARSIKSSARI